MLRRLPTWGSPPGTPKLPLGYHEYGVKDWSNPGQNIMAQARYDASLHKSLGTWTDVFPAYNEGLGGFQAHGAAGTEPSYMAKVATEINALRSAGIPVDVHVEVTVRDSTGHTLPSTATIRRAATTAGTPPPGTRGHR